MILVFPRARTICCPHGFVSWDPFMESMFSILTRDRSLAAELEACAGAGKVVWNKSTGRLEVRTKIEREGMHVKLCLQVGERPDLDRAIVQFQRRVRAVQRRGRLCALAMGGHRRLGRDSNLRQLSSDLLAVISKWV